MITKIYFSKAHFTFVLDTLEGPRVVLLAGALLNLCEFPVINGGTHYLQGNLSMLFHSLVLQVIIKDTA